MVATFFKHHVHVGVLVSRRRKLPKANNVYTTGLYSSYKLYQTRQD